jgi:hypothetical protein
MRNTFFFFCKFCARPAHANNSLLGWLNLWFQSANHHTWHKKLRRFLLNNIVCMQCKSINWFDLWTLITMNYVCVQTKDLSKRQTLFIMRGIDFHNNNKYKYLFVCVCAQTYDLFYIYILEWMGNLRPNKKRQFSFIIIIIIVYTFLCARQVFEYIYHIWLAPFPWQRENGFGRKNICEKNYTLFTFNCVAIYNRIIDWFAVHSKSSRIWCHFAIGNLPLVA